MATPDSQSTVENDMRLGDFKTALDKLSNTLSLNPKDVEASYLSAVCLRYLKQYNEAQNVLNALKLTAPDHSRALQEQGHLFIAQNQPANAIEAFAKATKLNPALESSWKAQYALLQQLGQSQQAAIVNEQIQRLKATPTPLRTVIDLLAQGKLLKAEELCRKFMAKNPTHIEGMRQLAAVGARLGVLDDAEFLLESALELDTNNTQLRIDYLQILRKRQKFNAALEQAKKLYDSSPSSPQFQSLYAVECMQIGQYEIAIQLFKSILEQIPNEPSTLTSLGHAYKTNGNQDSAIKAYRQVLKTHPQQGEAWYSLANLKTVSFTEQDVQQMQAQLRNPLLVSADHVYLHFALGKAFEDQGQYEQSFDHYKQGNAIKKTQSRYDAAQMSKEFELQKQFCNAEFANKLGNGGYLAQDPIFIVGLPRAGSTLLEQILSSHSQVDGTLELPNILALAHELRRDKQTSNNSLYPEIIPKLSEEQRYQFGKAYIQDTKIHRQSAPFFIDKMPNNFRHIGLIKSILPNAKIIDARREPMGCCFSGFKQLFAEGQEFSYNLSDIGHYYRDYRSLMDHWDRVFPGEILRVNYDEVVDNLDQQVARILDYCGLDHEQQCIDFHATKRAVRTASSEQVRQPIYRDGLNQWQHYEAWLTPLSQALESDTSPTNNSL